MGAKVGWDTWVFSVVLVLKVPEEKGEASVKL